MKQKHRQALLQLYVSDQQCIAYEGASYIRGLVVYILKWKCIFIQIITFCTAGDDKYCQDNISVFSMYQFNMVAPKAGL